MRVTRETFRPITIVLENKEESDALLITLRDDEQRTRNPVIAELYARIIRAICGDINE